MFKQNIDKFFKILEEMSQLQNHSFDYKQAYKLYVTEACHLAKLNMFLNNYLKIQSEISTLSPGIVSDKYDDQYFLKI